jgi:hypothetical protein
MTGVSPKPCIARGSPGGLNENARYRDDDDAL